MKLPISDIAFTPSVKAAFRSEWDHAHTMSRMEERRQDGRTRSHQELSEFLNEVDSHLYGHGQQAKGRPYIQHRGGP